MTILWVAEHFTEEHRAALDWLNRLTNEGVNFFGIEIELYKIGDSAPAPNFKVVAKPNNWAKHIRSAARNTELSEIKQKQFEYWLQLKALLQKEQHDFNLREPSPNYYYIITFGRGDCRIRVFANTKDKSIGVIFVLRGPYANQKFAELKDKYEKEAANYFNNNMEWQFEEDRIKQNIIYWIPDTDCLKEEDWSRQHNLLKEIIFKMFNYFIGKM